MSIIENFNSNLQFFPSNKSSQNKNFFSSNSLEISNLENSRIIQKNLVYIIGLSLNLIKKDSLLKNYEFFGQYGKITKFVINKNKTYNSNNPNGPSYSCYVTYSNDSESSLAILALDNTIIDNHIIKASYGTTKYCLNFLKNSKCLNKDCLFLHKFANDEDIISKDELNNNKNLFSNQHVLAIKLSKIFTKEKRALIEKNKHLRTYFPNSYVVYSKDIVLCYLQTNLNYMNFQNFMFNNQNKFEFNYNINSNINNNRFINNLNENNNNNFNDNNNNNNDNNDNNDNNNNKNKKKITYITINSLNKIFKSKKESRFDFVIEKNPANNNNIDVPLDIQLFLDKNLRHSVLYEKEKEKEKVTDKYFNIVKNRDFNNNNNNTKSKDDNWSTLISILKMYNEFNEMNESKTKVNDSIILIDKFNSI